MAKVLNASLKEGPLGWLEFEPSLLKALETFLQIVQVVLESLPQNDDITYIHKTLRPLKSSQGEAH